MTRQRMLGGAQRLSTSMLSQSVLQSTGLRVALMCMASYQLYARITGAEMEYQMRGQDLCQKVN
jgi:hypothetical protein